MSNKVMGVFNVCNTGGISIYEIKHGRIKAGWNDEKPSWYDLDLSHENEDGTTRPGFYFGQIFVPFDEVLRVD